MRSSSAISSVSSRGWTLSALAAGRLRSTRGTSDRTGSTSTGAGAASISSSPGENRHGRFRGGHLGCLGFSSPRHAHAGAATRAANFLAGQVGLGRELPAARGASELESLRRRRRVRLCDRFHGGRNRQRLATSMTFDLLPDLGPNRVVHMAAFAAIKREFHVRRPWSASRLMRINDDAWRDVSSKSIAFGRRRFDRPDYLRRSQRQPNTEVDRRQLPHTSRLAVRATSS